MKYFFTDPRTGGNLHHAGDAYVALDGTRYPIINDIPRFCDVENYTTNFGKQWNWFRQSQIDGEGWSDDVSRNRFFLATDWKASELDKINILEVGSGAGRFSRVVLAHTNANLFSVDYSNAVEANLENNREIAGDRLCLAQASVYEMPFPNNFFEKVFCLGVLQHTPDFAKSIESLVKKAKTGGEIVIDFYPIRGWYTKIHSKYLFRPITKRMSHERLLSIIQRNADWMIRLSQSLRRAGLETITRFLPLVDLKTLAKDLSPAQLKEQVVLDTFDMFSPEYDNPQRLQDVAKMMADAGAKVEFAGYVQIGGVMSAVVRARKA